MIRKGTYVLAITLGADTEIQVGALGNLSFSKGMYCYVGSAMGGLDQRLRRHLSKDKIMKWHADYLTVRADECRAYISYPDFVPECDLAAMAESCGMEPSFKGFGCSDCGCRTHLFRCTDKSLKALIDRARLDEYNLILSH